MEYILKISTYILEGAILTFKIWGVTFVLSMPIAIVLAFIYEQSNMNRFIKYLINSYTTVIRGTPLLFQLYFVYYGLPILAGIKFESFIAVIICFVSSWSAYLTEIFRGGIRSIDKGQYEAAFVLGLNKFQTIFYVILPQVFIAVIPSISNQALSLIYGTSLVSTIGLGDILKNAKVSVVRDFRLEAFAIAGLLYLLIGIIFIRISKLLENYFSKYKLQ